MTTPIVDDIRIEKMQSIITPKALIEELPIDDGVAEQVFLSRKAVEGIIHGADDRLLVIVGPCSIHDPQAAHEYARLLSDLARALAGELLVVMRVYFEKPRTTVGWKGLINDPHLDGSYAINEGLHLARKLLLDINRMGLPCATEFLDIISPQFVADLISWGAIGARTTESQVHRELASGLSCPIGFKNGTGGNVGIAADAIRSARQKHRFLSVTKKGEIAVSHTRGNKACHVILRGGGGAPNYSAEDVENATHILAQAGLSPRLMIDCSHANSGKDYRRQPEVAGEIGAQVAGGDLRIIGLMMESHLVEGRQELTPENDLTYGMSITDACMGWEATEEVLKQLAQTVTERRRYLRRQE